MFKNWVEEYACRAFYLMCWSFGISSQSKQHIVSPVKNLFPVDSWNNNDDIKVNEEYPDKIKSRLYNEE